MLGFDIQQVLIHLLNFVILTCILYFLLYSPVKKFMDNRKKSIADKQTEVQNKLKDAEEIKSEYNRQLEQFNAEKQQMKLDCDNELQTYRDEQIKQAEQQAEKIIADAKAGAQLEKKKIVSGATKEIKQIVEEATTKMALDMDSNQSIDEFLKFAERGESVEKDK